MKLIVNINLRVCYVAQVYVDTDGNVLQKAISTVNTVESGNLHSVTSNAVAGGIFIPSYGSNGGTLILVDYPSTRFLFNVWIDSNRWSGWHYVDLAEIVYS